MRKKYSNLFWSIVFVAYRQCCWWQWINGWYSFSLLWSRSGCSNHFNTHSCSKTFLQSTSCTNMTIEYIDNTIIIEMTFQLFLNKSIHMFIHVWCCTYLTRLSIASEENLTWLTNNCSVIRISCRSATNFAFGSNSCCLLHLVSSVHR